MKVRRIHFWGLIFALVSVVYAENSERLAKKYYAEGSYLKAAKYFRMSSNTSMAMQSEVIAVSQEAPQSDAVKNELKKLDSLLLVMEPEESAYSDLLILKTYLLHGIGEEIKALKSLKFAGIYASPKQQNRLEGLCASIYGALRDGVRRDSCKQRLQKIPGNLELLPLKDGVVLKHSKKPISGQVYCLQLGAFSSRDNAKRMLKNFSFSGVDSWIEERESSGKMLYLSRIGSFASRSEAEEFGNQNLTPQDQKFLVIMR